MATDPVTKKKIKNPKNPIHTFESKETFDVFIESLDPLKEFKPEKREINWEATERNCEKCGAPFIAHHPAMMYCEKHRTSE